MTQVSVDLHWLLVRCFLVSRSGILRYSTLAVQEFYIDIGVLGMGVKC